MLLFRVGIVALLSIAVVIAQVYRPSYQWVDILVLLAVGMVLGAVYMEVLDRIHNHFAAQSK